MGVIDFKSNWQWINELPNAPPGEICGHCHSCAPLFEDVAARVIRVLQRPLPESVQQEVYQKWPRLRYINPLPRAQILGLYADIERIKRISGLYAQAFQILEGLQVSVPFVGTAAFTTNVVSWEVEDFTKSYAKTVLNWETRRLNTTGSPLLQNMLKTAKTIIAGNAVVLIEIFAIFDFCIKHFKKFGRPRSEDQLKEFEDCLETFISWWDRVQPGNRKFPGLDNIKIDRDRLVKEGIIRSLKATSKEKRLEASLDFILNNEQNHTLQQYMYDLMDLGVIDFFEIGLVLKGYHVEVKFSFDLYKSVDERFIITYDGSGWISEAKQRMPFAKKVVTRFDDLYYDDSTTRKILRAEHQKLMIYSQGY